MNSEGSPCLLLSNADPHDDGTWLPLEKLLTEITSRFDASKVNDKPVKKVVFLDVTRMLYDLNLGLLYNGFNEQLDAAVTANNDPYLVVVNASSSGEVSWPAPNYGGTVFGHFVGQGLSGHVANTDRDSDVVSLGELTNYLKSRVPAWVQTNRAASQHPDVRSVGTGWDKWEIAQTSAKSFDLRARSEDGRASTYCSAATRTEIGCDLAAV